MYVELIVTNGTQPLFRIASYVLAPRSYSCCNKLPEELISWRGWYVDGVLAVRFGFLSYLAFVLKNMTSCTTLHIFVLVYSISRRFLAKTILVVYLQKWFVAQRKSYVTWLSSLLINQQSYGFIVMNKLERRSHKWKKIIHIESKRDHLS